MTQFDQMGQTVLGTQQNAGRDIINNTLFPQAAWTPPQMLPPVAQSFVGRKEDLAWLLEQLTGDAGKILALCGPGGMGKTALAAEALSRLVAQPDWLVRFPGGLFYHSFYAYPSLTVAFEELACLFGEEPGADPRRAALRALSRRRTLLVFDGVEALADALPLRELGGTHVVLLLSRRQSDALDLVHRRTLDVLPVDQGIALLQKLAGPRGADRQCVQRLVKQIGGYPLALQLIGCYLSSRQEEVADYLQRFEGEGLATLDHGAHHTQSIPVLLQQTYDSLTPNEQQVFTVLGLLAPAPFPLEVVQAILAFSERVLGEAMGSLVNLSVLRRPKVGYEVSHPLIHTFATKYLLSSGHAISSLSSETLATWRERFLTILETHFEQRNPYGGGTLALWLPHVLNLLPASHLTAQQDLRAARLFNNVGFDASTQAQYAEAEPLLKRALAIREEQLGPVHPNTASSLNSLTILYRNLGRYAEAEPLLKRALAICKQELGPIHPNTASNLNNLAGLYYEQGKYAEAEPLFKQALAIREQQLGATHPDTAQSLNDLAALYHNLVRYAEAESLYQRALAICEQELGPTHPDTASNLNNLAGIYHKQAQYAEAESLYQRALAIREQQLGPIHPNTASSLNSLAALYHDQGRYVEAEPLHQRALAIREQQLGPTHPGTADSLNNLAALYHKQEKYEQTEPLYQRALAVREQQLGAMHPDTASSLNSLAVLYHDQGRYAEAEPLYQRALAIREQQLGATHPSTASSLDNLASLYYKQGKYKQAEPLLKQILAICEQQLGATHPSTASSLNDLAALYIVQGKYKQAEPLLKRALEIYEQELGATHTDTQTIRENQAFLLRIIEHQVK